MQNTLQRPSHIVSIHRLLRQSPVVALIGARQVGKTTLARNIASQWKGRTDYLDLESSADLARLADPLLTLAQARGLTVIDEIQRVPRLFEALRVLVDRRLPGRRFLVLGSAAPELLRQGSETLAGRIAWHELGGLGLQETGVAKANRLWVRGGFPRAFLARSDADSQRWREEFIRTFLERDIPQLGLRIPAPTLRRFWTMIAHYHGQTWNSSELARAFGVAHTTVQRYLDILSETFMVRQLPPWFENISKRQVRSPKVYFRDSGLLHSLLGVRSARELESHPKIGASWEGFALNSVIEHLGARSGEIYFWGTHASAELDLLVLRGNTRIGFEFKHASNPSVTPSMRIACADLRLQRLYVIHGGDSTFPLSAKIHAVPLRRLLEDIPTLR